VRLNLPTKPLSIFDKKGWRILLSEHFPLLSILIGIVLVSVTIGPFHNGDTQLEYEAATGVIRWGMPYMKYAGDIINQPPLGFYTAGLFFKVFGLSSDMGVALVTLFGLGCTILVYKIGKIWYGKPTGLLAAALFALTPWQLALSRSFLIDVQCLFFSLLFLFVGIHAIRRDSFNLFMVSGALFAVALLTKFFAIFALIPLALFYFYHRQKRLRRPLAVVAYFLPALLLVFLWYYVIWGRGLFSATSHSALSHDDFLNVNAPGVVPSYLFVGNFLLNGLGALFLIATVLSLLVCFWRRKLFANMFLFDLICLATIVAVGSVNTFLGAGLNLNFPYHNAIKYDYQALPFFSLLAASLVSKFILLLNTDKSKEKLLRRLFYLALGGLLLLAISMFLNMNYVNQFSTSDHLLFKVEIDKNIGYSLVNSTPIGKASPLANIQYAGFAFVLFGFIWAVRSKFDSVRKVALQQKWRVAFLVFAVIYAFFLLLDLSFMAIQWDEITHLNGGLLLLQGNYQDYFAFNAFYPPMFDMITAGFFDIGGVSVFAGRFVSVTFALLSLWVVFEMANRMYGPKIALISSVLLGLMPGFVWLSRVAMIETMLVFFFTVTMFFFFNWIRTHRNRDLILSGLTLGIGFLVKYQMLVAGVIMIASIFILSRDYLKAKLSKMPLLIVAVALVVIPWIFISYQIYASGMLDQWIYALSIGNPEKSLYSTRFPLPIFYFIEITWPYSNVHPISLLLYIVGLLGLGLFAWRRKTEDKFLLTWFLVVFIFFTLIANKHWRYVMPLFPVLAITAASLIMFVYGKAGKTWKSSQISLNKKRAAKVAAGFFTVFLAVSVFYTVSDTYSWVAKDQIKIPIDAATRYASDRLSENESIMVVCAFNLFSQDVVRFYLRAENAKNNQVWQYPELPVDTYTPNFNINEFVALCEEHNVKYVFFYEYGGTVPYFNTTLSLHEIFMDIYDSGRFSELSNETTFGYNPRRIFVLTFYK